MISLRRGESPTATTVHLPGLTLVFSYETIVAFRVNGEWIVSENVWSKTTGKHLNQECPPVPRVEHEEFQRRLADVIGGIEFIPMKHAERHAVQ